MKAFIEFGTGRRAELDWLLLNNWKSVAHENPVMLGEKLVEYTDTWYGILVDPHPANLVELLDRLATTYSSSRYKVVSGLLQQRQK